MSIQQIGIIQPPYPSGKRNISPQEVYDFILDTLKNMDQGLDLVVLPEYSNCSGIESKEEILDFCHGYSRNFTEIISEIAKDKKVNIAANMMGCQDDSGFLKNLTYLFSRDGEVIACYDKSHLTKYEKESLSVRQGNGAYVIEVEGIRIGFVTCFDIYFAEYFEGLAVKRPDIIIFPSYQRSEASRIIEIQTQGRAIDTNSYIIRSSYSFGNLSPVGGCSMVVNPWGEILLNAGQGVGLFTWDIDPKKKRERPESFGQSVVDAREIIEGSRRPEIYRYSGTNIRLTNDETPYPRVVAHRGLSQACPENTLEAFAAAVAAGAHEIELDVCSSLDGELVISHDTWVDRISDGSGLISEMTWDEIQKLDIGSWKGSEWKGARFCSFEEVLKLLAGQVIINIHVKNEDDYNQDILYKRVEKIIQLLKKYDCTRYAYIAGDKQVLEAAIEIDSSIERCCLEGQTDMTLLDNAIKYRCSKMQIFKPHFDGEMIQNAHENGIRCNIFWSDDPKEAEKFLGMGIDSILTNNTLAIEPVVQGFKKYDK